MSKYMCVHPVGSNMDPDVATPLAKAFYAMCANGADWIRSRYAPEDDRFYR